MTRKDGTPMKNKFKYTMPAAALIAVLAVSGCGTDSVSVSETEAQTTATESTEALSGDGSGISAVLTVPENTEIFADEEEAFHENVSEEETTAAAESAESEEEPLYDLSGEDKAEEPKAGFLDESFAEGDIVIIGIGSNFLDCSVKYGNVKLLEDESTSGSLYFQGVTAGKDNIVISESTDSGVVFREYTVIINEDLSVDLYPSNDFSLYTAQ